MEVRILSRFSEINKLFNYKSKNILIVGGTSGIGAHFANFFFKLKANVIVLGRNKKKLDQINREKKIFGICCDITNEIQLDKTINLLKKKIKFIDIIIFTSGINIRENFINLNLNNFKKVINTNLIAAINFYKKIIPFIQNKKKKTNIINFTSILSTRTLLQRTSYSISKAGLLMLTRNLALELKDLNVVVNSISPGPLLTKINKPVLKNKKKYLQMCSKIPMERFGKVNELETAILFLSSDKSTYITGSEIVIDGGWQIL